MCPNGLSHPLPSIPEKPPLTHVYLYIKPEFKRNDKVKSTNQSDPRPHINRRGTHSLPIKECNRLSVIDRSFSFYSPASCNPRWNPIEIKPFELNKTFWGLLCESQNPTFGEYLSLWSIFSFLDI